MLTWKKSTKYVINYKEQGCAENATNCERKKYIKASVSKQISGSLHNNLYHQINYKRVDGYRKLKERESARFLTIC